MESNLNQLKLQAEIEMKKLEMESSAREVASKSIGKYGLAYITLIILIGVGSSAFLPEAAITAVMTMVGGALVALISMLQGITGTQEKEEKPEIKIIHDLVSRLDTKEDPMRVTVEGDRVTVTKGDDTVTAKTTQKE